VGDTVVRGLLVSFSGYPWTPTSLMPDNGLAALAGSLMAAGHEVRILDYGTTSLVKRLVPKNLQEGLRKAYSTLSSEAGWPRKALSLCKLARFERILAKKMEEESWRIAEEVSGLIEKEQVGFVGFKLWVGDGLAPSIAIAEEVKRRYPRMKVYGGGPLIDVVKETLFRRTKVFDALAFAEGEETILGLAEHAAGKRDLNGIPNLVFPDGSRIGRTSTRRVKDLNSLPPPVYDPEIYPSLRGDGKIKVFVVEESRGCPNHCAFCPHIEKTGRWRREKRPDRILSEIRGLGQLGSRAFRYGGGNPPFNLLKRIAEGLLSSGMDVIYTSFGHVCEIDCAMLSTLRDSGLFALNFGIESGDDRILRDVMLKGHGVGEIRGALRASMGAGIYTVGSVIHPAPFETEESKVNTLNLLLDLFVGNRGSVQVFFPGLYPVSGWGREPEKFGFRVMDPGRYVEEHMDYQYRRLFPPRMWKPLPYTVNGKPFRKFIAETEWLVRELETHGISTNISDETALMSHLYDSSLPPVEFRDLCREVFFSGDWERMEEIVGRINEAVKARTSQWAKCVSG
jgi:radical SAM superfamily enzyme YgiQ (UPF0313 family)